MPRHYPSLIKEILKLATKELSWTNPKVLWNKLLRPLNPHLELHFSVFLQTYPFSFVLCWANHREIHPTSLEDSPYSQDLETSQWKITHLFWYTENFSTVVTFHVWKLKWWERPKKMTERSEKREFETYFPPSKTRDLRVTLGLFVMKPGENSVNPYA